MILLEVTILNYVGTGPMWYRIHHQAVVNCEKYWWSSLLYVQNYVNPLNIVSSQMRHKILFLLLFPIFLIQQCITQTWYLSADMQMFWLGPILLYPLYLWPIFGGVLLFTVLMLSCWASFAVTYIYDLPPSFVLHPK